MTGEQKRRSSSEAVARKTRMGFNLIESAIVLGVVGLVIGGIWYAAAAMYENYKVNKTINDIALIVKNVQELISIRDAESIGNAVNITTTLIKAGVFPETWVNENNVINPFGAIAEVLNLAQPAGASTRFFIRFYGIPQSSCIKLTVKISSIGAIAGSRGSGFFYRESLGYIGFAPPPIGTPVYLNAFPISPETAKTVCTGTSNQMEFGFGYTRIN